MIQQISPQQTPSAIQELVTLAESLRSQIGNIFNYRSGTARVDMQRTKIFYSRAELDENNGHIDTITKIRVSSGKGQLCVVLEPMMLYYSPVSQFRNGSELELLACVNILPDSKPPVCFNEERIPVAQEIMLDAIADLKERKEPLRRLDFNLP